MVSTVERCSWLRKIVPNLVPIFVHYYHHHHSCSAAAAVMLEMGTFSDSRIDGIFAGNWPRRPNLMDFRWGRSTTSFSKRFFCSSSASRDDDDSRAHIVIPFGISSNQSWIIRNYDDGLFKHQMMITELTSSSLYSRCRRETIFHIHLSHPWSSWLWSVVCIIFPSQLTKVKRNKATLHFASKISLNFTMIQNEIQRTRPARHVLVFY